MTLTFSLAVYLFIVQLLSFIIKGLVGFGNPLLSSPLMAMRLENKTITPSNLLLDLPVNAWMAWKNRKHFNIKAVLPVVGWIMLGVIPGTFFLKAASPWIIKAILGLFIIGLGVEMATRDSGKKITPNRFVKIFVSLISGIMGGLFGINLLFLAYFERVSQDRQEFRGNICFVFFIENAFRATLYFFNDMFTPLSLQITLLSIPAAVLGIYCGTRIDKKLKEATIKKMVVGVFILGGISILVKALVFQN